MMYWITHGFSAFNYRFDNAWPVLHDIGGQIDTLGKMVEEIGTILRMLTLGVEYKHYLMFHARSPQVLTHFQTDVPEGVGYDVRWPPYKTATADDFDFCFNFVIECAVKIDAFKAGIE
jgi:hypothetical protein